MLAVAATIGRFFGFEILQASSGADADSILVCVEEAEKAGLVFSVAESPETRFEFSHELIRQAVISGLSAARPQMLHLGVADAIERIYSAQSESKYGGSLGDHIAQLAHHYARGGEPAKAVKYCLRAVRRFAYLGSNAEALGQFAVGLELLAGLPDDDRRAELELDLRTAVAGPLGDSKGLASFEVEQSNTRSLTLSQRPGINWKKNWEALYSLLFVHLTRADPRKACEL